jgi:hypothetical protein
MKTREPQMLSFYTEGEGFTNLLRSFIEEGRNFVVYQILRDGGFNEDLTNKFIRGKIKFTGTTQFGDGLGVEEDEIDSLALLRQSIKSVLAKYKEYEECDEYDEYDEYGLDELEVLRKYINDGDIRILANAYGKETLFSLYRTDELNEYTIGLINKGGYGVLKRDSIRSYNFSNLMDGLILPSGDIITCGYQEHSSLYPFLYKLGLVKATCWTNCEETIHISSKQISGKVAHSIGNKWGDTGATPEQLLTLFKLRGHLHTYGYDDNITTKILQDVCEDENFGGKWNNLIFLDRYYPNILLPRFSKEPIDGVKNCIRTSPKYSLPGLLESVFDITENSISEMKEKFEKFKGVREDNELNLFYQEYLDGPNGVFHFDQDGFRYDISTNRGDIVQGKRGGNFVSETAIRVLYKIGKELYEDFRDPIQVEFVIIGDDAYVVQLRILENSAEKTHLLSLPEEYLAMGKTFSKGRGTINVKDILVIDSDGESELLLGKKALIVKGDVEFSHILALSKALRIPSIYGTGDVDLPSEGDVDFIAYNKTGWIEK